MTFLERVCEVAVLSGELAALALVDIALQAMTRAVMDPVRKHADFKSGSRKGAAPTCGSKSGDRPRNEVQ